jgi:hypothetical protein
MDGGPPASGAVRRDGLASRCEEGWGPAGRLAFGRSGYDAVPALRAGVGEGITAMSSFVMIFWGGLIWVAATGNQVAHLIDWIAVMAVWMAIYQTVALWRGHLMINRIIASIDAQEALLRKVHDEQETE